jgi:colanic acid/amylovoran biosynthesis glycosyltransferase
MDGRLLLVIPPVALRVNGEVQLDIDFASNLRAYLASFETVVVACPFQPSMQHSGFPATVPVDSIAGHERATVIELPYPYREDRYYRNLGTMKTLLQDEIDRADYLLFSPHAAFEWSTRAALIALEMGRSYDMEGDWALANVSWSQWRGMPWGPTKLRKWFWIREHCKVYDRCMRGSSVALLQGQAVFDANKDIAPNPHKVLNVQVTPDDYLSEAELDRKLAGIERGEPLQLVYAGRAIAMKGPFDWIDSLVELAAQNVAFQATWFGDGDLLDAARERVGRNGLERMVHFPGRVERDAAMATLRHAHLFVFCHQTEESPRCLVEALTRAAPIVGFGSLYASDLVEGGGGGAFVPVGDWRGLAQIVSNLDRDRAALAQLIRAAHRTAQSFDRDAAIANRIALIRRYVVPPARATAVRE